MCKKNNCLSNIFQTVKLFSIILIISFFPIWSNFLTKFFLGQNFATPYYDIYQTIFILLLSTYVSYIYYGYKQLSSLHIQIFIVIFSLVFATFSIIQQQIKVSSKYYELFNTTLLMLIGIYALLNLYIYYKDYTEKLPTDAQVEENAFNTVEERTSQISSSIVANDFPTLENIENGDNENEQQNL